jgi:hypothetical protein
MATVSISMDEALAAFQSYNKDSRRELSDEIEGPLPVGTESPEQTRAPIPIDTYPTIRQQQGEKPYRLVRARRPG